VNCLVCFSVIVHHSKVVGMEIFRDIYTMFTIGNDTTYYTKVRLSSALVCDVLDACQLKYLT